MKAQGKGKLIPALLVLGLVAGGGVAWRLWRGPGAAAVVVSGNGRIEATEVDVATKLPGRVAEILVDEGAFVEAGQVLARMQVDALEAQRDEARAAQQQAIQSVAAAEAQQAARESDRAAAEAMLAQRQSDVTAAEAGVSQRESGVVAAQAVVTQRETELDAARRRLVRSETLSGEGASSIQELDDDRARTASAQAAVSAARAQVATAKAAVSASQAQVAMAKAAITAARAQVATARAMVTAARAQVEAAQLAVHARQAGVARIETDIADATLKAPRAGRIQYRTAQPGEVLGGGGKVLNLVDLSDVYMTFFLPETAVGRVALGSEARIVLDAAPQYVIPARVSFVASTAQFTPKSVETASERQKLMFRVKARIDRNLLREHIQVVKTGLPGLAWVKLDAQAAWPPELAVKVTK